MSQCRPICQERMFVLLFVTMPKVSDAHRAARREQILDAAIRCVGREGFHRTTMAHVIAESGLSSGAVYGYFKGKPDLIKAIAGRALGGFSELLHDIASGSAPVTVAGAMRAMVHEVERLGAESDGAFPKVVMHAWSEAARDSEILRIVGENVDRVHAAWVAVLRACRAPTATSRGPGRDTRMARVLIGLMPGFVLQGLLLGKVDAQDVRRRVRVAHRPLRRPLATHALLRAVLHAWLRCRQSPGLRPLPPPPCHRTSIATLATSGLPSDLLVYGMPVDQSLVGRVFPPTRPYAVTEENVRAFVAATGGEYAGGPAPADVPDRARLRRDERVPRGRGDRPVPDRARRAEVRLRAAGAARRRADRDADRRVAAPDRRQRHHRHHAARSPTTPAPLVCSTSATLVPPGGRRMSLADPDLHVTRADLVAYAEASGDHNPIHQDERSPRSVGLPGVIAHGMYTMALAARAVQTWFPDAEVVELRLQVHQPGRRARRGRRRDRGRRRGQGRRRRPDHRRARPSPAAARRCSACPRPSLRG